jgi:hypothetical protein
MLEVLADHVVLLLRFDHLLTESFLIIQQHAGIPMYLQLFGV